MGKIRNKIISVFLVLVLLCSGVPSAAWAADEVIAITTADELLWLSQACSVDGWSWDKQGLLEADIDLTGTAFKTIPTFGGVFDGQGHAITGLAVIGSGNVRGLFRYI